MQYYQCYQCGNEVTQLSNRSRCIECESSRASFNENDTLRQQLGEFQIAEKNTSDAYLRLREILGSFDTPYAPSPELVWTHTEMKARQAVEQQAMITAFRHAANSLGKTTGVIVSHVEHDEAAKSVTGDHYFLELLAESELRYNRLKAAAESVLLDHEYPPASGEVQGSAAIQHLKEALK
jgi:hypothetical protein